MVAAFIFLLEKNRNLWLKLDCKAQVCPLSQRLAALGVTGLSSTEFTVGGRNSLVVHGEHVLGECYSQFGAEASALAAVCRTCEVGLTLGDSSGGGAITVCTRNLDSVSSASCIPCAFNHPLQHHILGQLNRAAPSLPQAPSWSCGGEIILKVL